MDFAARRPAPSARITVAPPVTMSPPAKTPGRFVAWVDSSLPSSAAMFPHLLSWRPGVDWVTTGFALVPRATITVSHSMSLNLPVGTGERRPFASGSPRTISSTFMPFTLPSASA